MMLRSIDAHALQLLLRSALRDGDEDAVVSDEAALDAALAYPLLQAMQRDADVADLAAAHACGILKCRPFAAQNKQAALLALGLFLYLNRWPLHAPQVETARVIRQAGTAELDERGLADWIRQHL